MLRSKIYLGAALALLPMAGISLAQQSNTEKAPAAAATEKRISLLEVVKNLEEADYGPIVEVSFDDGVWEVETYKQDDSFELTIDPATGEIIAEHRDNGDPKPPAESLKLSEIVEKIADAGYTNVHEISFEGRTWEAEVRRDGTKRELRLNPKTGEVVEDRVDD